MKSMYVESGVYYIEGIVYLRVSLSDIVKKLTIASLITGELRVFWSTDRRVRDRAKGGRP